MKSAFSSTLATLATPTLTTISPLSASHGWQRRISLYACQPWTGEGHAQETLCAVARHPTTHHHAKGVNN